MRKEAAIEVNCVPVEHFLKLLKLQKKLVSDLEAFGVEAIEMENQETGKAAMANFQAGFQGACFQGAILVADAAVLGRVGRVTGSGWG